jgi:translation initiation factor IF-3
VIVIDAEGQNLGEMPTKEALDLAYEQGLDLVEINPTNRPPITKVMDFGKYKYDLAKKEKEAKANRKEVELKEIRLTFKIGDHDLEYKAKQAKEFFEDGNKVKVSMRLRGRENALGEIAMEVFNRFLTKTELGYEGRPQRTGNLIIAMLAAPKVKE